MFKPGLTSASMVLRYSIEYIIEWAYELTDSLWMDGWMDGKMEGTQAEAESRDDNRYPGAEILYCFTNLNDLKGLVYF